MGLKKQSNSQTHMGPLVVLLLVSKERLDLAALGKSKTIRAHVAPNEMREE